VTRSMALTIRGMGPRPGPVRRARAPGLAEPGDADSDQAAAASSALRPPVTVNRECRRPYFGFQVARGVSCRLRPVTLRDTATRTPLPSSSEVFKLIMRKMVRNNFVGLTQFFGLLFLHISTCTAPTKISSPPLRQVSSKPATSTSTTAAAAAAAQRLQGEWRRVFLKGNHPIDSNMVTELLNARTAAKSRKDFAEADRAAAQLQSIGVCYDDSQFTWYNRDPDPKPSTKPALSGSTSSNTEKSSAGKKRSRQDAEDEKPKKKPQPSAATAADAMSDSAAPAAVAAAGKRTDKAGKGGGSGAGKAGSAAAKSSAGGKKAVSAAAAEAAEASDDAEEPRAKKSKKADKSAAAGPPAAIVKKKAGKQKPGKK
jgi:hypothetical protein